MRKATLGFLIKDDEILLALKKRGFAEGKYNGFGGKVESDETIEECLIREAKEELNIDIKDFKKVGVLDFLFPHKEEWGQQVHAYFCSVWEGEPEESEELRPIWVKRNNLPVDKMWDDHNYWLHEVFKDKFVRGEFIFNENNKVVKFKMTKHENSSNDSN